MTVQFDPDHGPLLTVGIGKPSFLNGGERQVMLTQFIALMDTGAQRTFISPSVAAQLDLPILGKGQRLS